MILGESDAALAIREFGRRAAAVDATVLLTGESGTGKGLLAQAIHAASTRQRNAFVSVNCASVPESLFESEFFGHARGAFTGALQSHRGLFEQANRGTLFLDEIGELAAMLQAKLLTALEDGQFRRVGGERAVHSDVRFIAATGIDLEQAVVSGRFRRDLYHRLVVLSFRLPPLRERGADIDFFADHYLDVFRRRYSKPVRGFDGVALARIRSHVWPGNIRELANAIEAAVLACDTDRVGVRHLPPTVRTPSPTSAAITTATDPLAPPAGRYSHYGTPAEERRRIEAVLARCRGNKTRAARELGMARNTLRGKLRGFRESVGNREPAA